MSSKSPKKLDIRPLKVKNNGPVPLVNFVSQFPTNSDSGPVVAIHVNGVTHSLHATIHRNCEVELKPVYLNSLEGEAIVRRSLVFVMSTAIKLIYGHKNWFVEHPLDNGYFCRFEEYKIKKDENFVTKLKEKMMEIIKAEVDITVQKLYHHEAKKFFSEQKLKYTSSLISTMNPFEIDVDRIMSEKLSVNFMLIHHRALIHNTKMLKDIKFSLQEKTVANEKTKEKGEPRTPLVSKEMSKQITSFTQIDGWIIIFEFSKFAHYYQSEESDVNEDERVIKIHKDRNDFVRTIECECVGDLNKRILNKKIEEFILLNNTFQDRIMNSMVRRIQKNGTRIKLILIAGPSSSGKTTFAKKLRRNLICGRMKSVTLGVDNYYKKRTEIPNEVDDKTKKNFECLEALRVDKLNEDLVNLLVHKKKIWIPKYNFHTGDFTDKGKELQIGDDTLLIMEGIHCLNDKLTTKIGRTLKYKIFIAPFTPLNLDDRNFISNEKIRLLRRIVRDYTHRGYTVEDTIQQWPSVKKGEHEFIFPYLKQADYIFNSALDYEVGVLKPYAIDLLKSIKPSSPCYNKAYEMSHFLQKFLEVPYKYIPRDSLLQEFLGGHWKN